MNKFRIVMGAMALTVAAVAIVACSKEKTAQQETTIEQQSQNPNDYTLAEMIEVMSWEDGKVFLENQPIKDYTAVCEKVLNDCGFADKEAGLPYVISWVFRQPNEQCNVNVPGSCLVIRKKEDSSLQANALGYFEDDKLVIIPTTGEDGFTADGFLAIGAPIEVQYDSIVIQDGVYAAYFDEVLGRYVAVAVDYSIVE